ncbi:MAG: TIGR04084 family radical SAM/SPASM domain-containing protein [Caldisphaera sp.]|nr:MAG: putative peptide-modifying radical SAM/SPASM domain-containing protein [Caldisphaera sp.]
MLWILTATGQCNLKCDYCGGSFPNNIVPWKINYDINKLKKLIEKDNNPIIIFYGGEPLLNPKFIIDVLNNINAKRFGIQTNGLLIKNLPNYYWKKINVALLSIDGRKEITDKHRGKGVYDNVIKSATYLKEINNKIETIARMTATKDTDIYLDVMHLIDLKIFDKIHWQLNVIWSKPWNFKEWAYENYLPGLKKLINYFLGQAMKGKLIKIIPILGLLSAHYFSGYIGSPCGAGYKSITVSSDGRILACPIAVREQWSVLGNVNSGYKLMQDPLPDVCKNCEFKRYCGGRCLYAYMEPYWDKEGFEIVDDVNKQYIKYVLSIIPKIDELIKDKVIDINDLYYDPTLDSTEVIP